MVPRKEQKQTDQGSMSLENQLRSMILSNVTISQDQQDQRSPQGERQNHGHRQIPLDGSPRSRGRGWNMRSRGNQRPVAPHDTRSNVNRIPTNQQLSRSNNDRSHYPQDFSSTTPSHPPKVLLQRQRSVNNTPAASALSPMQPGAQNSARQPASQNWYSMNQSNDITRTQIQYLDYLANQEVPKVMIHPTELAEKETFRSSLEAICRKVVAEKYSGNIESASLVGFGSLTSGFATPGSDMDLAVVAKWKDGTHRTLTNALQSDSDIPRLFEKAVLESQMGGRLLTKTRVPILKVCEKPTAQLYEALTEERKRWDELPNEEKYPPPTPVKSSVFAEQNRHSSEQPKQPTPSHPHAVENDLNVDIQASKEACALEPKLADSKQTPTSADSLSKNREGRNDLQIEKPWLREKLLGPLDFPKTGVGIQCDINFENSLGIHNTHLLRCYNFCDPRVRPMILFVKSWAKRRKINSSYSGTLSSYGYVLMVLHYLVNVAQPPVCPNLQLHHKYKKYRNVEELEAAFSDKLTVDGWTVQFWGNEEEIVAAAQSGQLTRNEQSLGRLLLGFFHYYASPSAGFQYGPRPPSFYWTNEVLSIRTQGGICTKLSKGWTGAKTTTVGGKEVRHRYLFAIEDPFELDHNVARTVTHRGIVAIRDEFRRTWRILSNIGMGVQPEGGIFDEIVEQPPETPSAPKVVDMETVPAEKESMKAEKEPTSELASAEKELGAT